MKIIAVKGSPRKNGDTNTVIDALLSVDAYHFILPATPASSGRRSCRF